MKKDNMRNEDGVVGILNWQRKIRNITRVKGVGNEDKVDDGSGM
jgi:hypothetical protein